jgi:hypothetical protein
MIGNMRKVAVFGLNFSYKQIILTDTELTFVENHYSQDFSGFDILIYVSDTFRFEYERGAFGQSLLVDASAEAIRREKEFRVALEQGKIVCFIGSNSNDHVTSRILNSIKIYSNSISTDHSICSTLIVKRSEFKPFLANVGATRIFFDGKNVDDIICTTDYNLVVGFSKCIGKGMVLFIPCIFGSAEKKYVIENIEKLVNGLVSFSAKKIFETPSYLENIKFKNEETAILRIKELTEKEIKPLKEKVAFYSQLKRVLWFGDSMLVEVTCTFLENMGFKTRIIDIGEEDFWLLADGKQIAIVEVKGLNNNLKREDLAKADAHREARQVPHLTSLLIANTFMTAQSIDRKNEAISTNVIEKAVQLNMIITRTLDLFYIYNYMDQNNLTYTWLLDCINGKKGWLTMQGNKIILKEK